MDMDFVSIEDRAAASAVAALGAKRCREGGEEDDDDDLNFDSRHAKQGRSEDASTTHHQSPPQQAMVANMMPAPMAAAAAAGVPGQGSEIKPYPFFFYEDYSTEKDPDPLTPLTPPGRVPNFPAKMHSILSRADLVDIIAWMPHGRSWRVLKPREFEIRSECTYT
jgi:hypothetical protein